MLAVLVVVVVAGLIQVALTLHVRNTLLSAASEGARYAAAYDRTPAQGITRTQDLIATSLGGYPATVTATEEGSGESSLVVVDVVAPAPMLGWWASGGVHVSAHALVEDFRG